MEIFVCGIFLILLFGKIVTGQVTENLQSGICKSEIRELRPKWGPYVETYSEFYRAACPPPKLGICILSRINTRHTIGLQREVIYKDPGKCCDGYKQMSVHPLRCEPICTTDCMNGYCKRPDECECNEGYERMTKYTCKPVCSAGCSTNGVCIAPGTCRCDHGYRNESSECLPVCTLGCLNGNCTAPDICTCRKGYLVTTFANVSSGCMPVCTKKCVNADCIAPEQCQCFPQYVVNASSNECIPAACADCRNGYCSKDNVCECHANYTRDPADGQCKPVCSRVCINGECWKPGKCICKVGYQWDAKDPYLCNPHCSRQCENGWCAAPEQCSCFDGYRKSENNSYACEPICEQLCQNGSCTENVCACYEGFVPQTGDKYKCVLQNEKVAAITVEETIDGGGGGIETKLPCMFSVRNAIKTESTSSCILFNENMTVKIKHVCKYLDTLTKNVCVNRYCEENKSSYNFCKSFLNCYVITEYVKSIDRNEYMFDCSQSTNVTQDDYTVDLNDTDINESNFTDWFSVDMRIDWFDFNTSKKKPFVVIHDATESTDDSCEWCLCPVDLRPKCDGTPFQLHICSCPKKLASYYKSPHISTTYIVLGILGGISILVGFVTILVLTGHYLWKRHREKNDPLKYREQEMNCKFENIRSNTTRGLIMEDEDSDAEGSAVTLTLAAFR